MDREALAERLATVERAVTDGETSDGLPEAAALEGRLEDLEATAATLEDRVAELEAATQALRGYVGGVDAVDRDVERRANAALAAVDRFERRRESTLEDRLDDVPEPSGPDDASPESAREGEGRTFVDRLRDAL